MRTIKGWFAGITILILITRVKLQSAAWKEPARPLLTFATRVANAKGADYFSQFCTWLSDQKVISVDYPALDWHKAPVVRLHDVVNGDTRKVALVNWPVGTHTTVACSPNGRWALCWNAQKPYSDDKVVAMDLQTKNTLAWPNLGDPYHLTNHWLSDSRRWLQFTTLEDGYITVYSVNSRNERLRLKISDPDLTKWRSHGYFVTNKDHMLIYNMPENNHRTWSLLDIREYRLLPSIVLLRQWRFVPPGGQKVQAISFSPSADRIAWIYSNYGRKSLWVSRVDGTEPLDIGYISDQPNKWGNRPDLTWLPSGKRLSFIYNKHLYTVPIDGSSRIKHSNERSSGLRRSH